MNLEKKTESKNKPGAKSSRKFSRAYWTANLVEFFERAAYDRRDRNNFPPESESAELNTV